MSQSLFNAFNERSLSLSGHRLRAVTNVLLLMASDGNDVIVSIDKSLMPE